MKKQFCIALVFFFSLFINFEIQSQEAQSTKIDSKYSYAEKIYLQLSSTIFTTDNTIWFKAIVTDLANVPTKLSGVLHVELIDFDKRIINKKLLKIKYGVADSFFDLNDDLPPGRYMLRAYTEWNKNFESAFISQTYIDIYAPKQILETEEAIRHVTLIETASEQFKLSAKAYPQLLNPKYKGKLKMYIHTDSKTDSVEIRKDKDDGYSFQYLLPKDVVKARMELKLDSIKLRNHNLGFLSSYSKTVAVDKEFLDLQFFPEGGKLVDGLTSIIAFKVLDYNNKGKQVSGFIVDEGNNIVTPFQSNALGMGTTFLTPKVGKIYYGQIKSKDGINLKFPLPKIHDNGVVLKVKAIEEYIVVSLKSKQLNETDFQVKVRSRGVVYDDFILQLENESASAGIEKRTLPEGIIKFTITNKANQIVCERLFFNYKESEPIFVSATPHLKHYSQRDKTVLNVGTMDKDRNAIKTNLSVLVINKAQLGNLNDTRSNILSYFLLNSELRGSIEQPSYYFNQQNKSRKHDMDALLLTQGWSNYKYENSAFSTNFKFLPELGLTVSGRINILLNSKKALKDPIDLTMIYGPLNVATQKVDSTGQFRFNLEDYYKDEFKVVIQSKTEKGKKKDFEITLDTYKSPKVSYAKQEHTQLADSTNNHVKQEIKRKQVAEDFKTATGTVALNEVKLDGYNFTPNREKMMDLHGPPDLVIENEELLREEKKWQWGLYSLLQSSFPDDIEIIDTEGFQFPFSQAKAYGSNFTFIVVDGVPVTLLDYPYIESLPIEEIKSFELIKNPKNTNYYTDQVFQEPFDEEEVGLLGITTSNSNLNAAGLYGVGALLPLKEEDPIRLVRDLKTSIISIYSYAGKGFNYIRRAKGMYKGFVSGFAPKREFYAPKYDDDSVNDWNVPDLRSVVHWAPNLETDEYGEAQVEFCNADNTGDMLVVIEGITEKGKMGYFEMTYTVDKKLEK